jgi:hypothetical protein
VRELLLFLSRDKGKSWEVYARATPDSRGFDFCSESDGLFYFSIVVIDRKGRQDPVDVSRAPVGQAICIDTAPPRVTAAAERVGGDVRIDWTVREDHLDRMTLEYEVDGAKGTIPVPSILKFAEGCSARFTPPGRGPVKMRLSVSDHAGNEAVVERAVAAAEEAPERKSESARERAAETPKREGATPPPTRGPLPPLQIVNRKTVTLDFDVKRLGPSGLGGVDVYVTADEGATWEKSAAEHKLDLPTTVGTRGSVAVSLPKDGLIYGFYLIVKSRAGLGKHPPQPGDVPQVRVELDTTEPEAEMYAPRADDARPDCLVLTWKASDRNLAPNPISLEWSPRPDGPWTFIGDAKLANSGRFLWQVPEDTPPKVYLRLSVRDMAGNVGIAATPQPVLIDLTTPEVGSVRVRTQAKAGKEEPGPKAELYASQSDPVQADCLVLTWKASGDNLAAKPITLEWACREGGPWTIIGDERMANTGRHLWQIPEGTPSMVHLRLTVRDRAGKTTVVQERVPIIIEPGARLPVQGSRVKR